MKIIYEKKEYFLIFWVLFSTVLGFITILGISWLFFVDNYLGIGALIRVLFVNMIFILMYTSKSFKKAVFNLIFYLLLSAIIYGISFYTASFYKTDFLHSSIVVFSEMNVLLILSMHLVLRLFYFQRESGNKKEKITEAWQKTKKVMKSVFIGFCVIFVVYILVMTVQSVYKKFVIRDDLIKCETRGQIGELESSKCDLIKSSSFINEKGNYVVSSTGKSKEENTVTIVAEYDDRNKLVFKTKTLKDNEGKITKFEWIDNLHGEKKGGWRIKN